MSPPTSILPVAVEFSPITGTLIHMCNHPDLRYNFDITSVQSFYARARPSVDEGIRRTKHFCSNNTVTNLFLAYSVLGLGYVYMLVVVLQDIDVDKSFCFPLVLTSVTGLFVWFPFYFWVVRARNGQLEEIDLDVHVIQRTDVPTPASTPTTVEKPPLYESLVFTSDSTLSSLPPPSYEVAILPTEDSQILPPEYSSRGTYIAVSLCSVHHQSSTSNPSVVHVPEEQESGGYPRPEP